MDCSTDDTDGPDETGSLLLIREIRLIRGQIQGSGQAAAGRSNRGSSFGLLELAVACAATHLVTFNKRDFAGAERFGIHVLTPEEFLAVLRS